MDREMLGGGWEERMTHITGLDVVVTTETPQKKIRMILQLNPLKSCFTVSIQTAFERIIVGQHAQLKCKTPFQKTPFPYYLRIK